MLFNSLCLLTSLPPLPAPNSPQRPTNPPPSSNSHKPTFPKPLSKPPIIPRSIIRTPTSPSLSFLLFSKVFFPPFFQRSYPAQPCWPFLSKSTSNSKNLNSVWSASASINRATKPFPDLSTSKPTLVTALSFQPF